MISRVLQHKFSGIDHAFAVGIYLTDIEVEVLVEGVVVGGDLSMYTGQLLLSFARPSLNLAGLCVWQTTVRFKTLTACSLIRAFSFAVSRSNDA